MRADQEKTLKRAFIAAKPALRRILRKALPVSQVKWAGVTLTIDPRDNFTELRMWMYGIPPERESLDLLLQIVGGQKAIVFDIGANFGLYATTLAKAAGAGSRVVAFEPNPVMVGRLGTNIQRNGLSRIVRVESVALGSEDGEATLTLAGGDLGRSSIAPQKSTKGTAIVVPQRPLRPYLSRLQDFDVSVLKIDIEGAEALALGPWLDAADRHERPDFILIETEHASGWPRDLVADIAAFGYETVYRGEGNTLFQRDTSATRIVHAEEYRDSDADPAM